MRSQTSDLRAALGNDAEFIFLNAPSEARGPADATIERVHANDKPFYEWVHARDAVPGDEGYSPDDKQWTWTIEGLDMANDYLDAKLQEIGPVDVGMGFSQGAIMLTSMSMRHAKRQPTPERWRKLCICVSGVAVRAIQARSLFETPDGRPIRVPFPSIHVVGKKDTFYNEGLRLANQYDDHPSGASSVLSKRIFVHQGSHKFPTGPENQTLNEELAQLIRSHFFGAETTSRL